MRDGEELVEQPFRRLIDEDKIMALKHDGFWRGMDTLKDQQGLEDLVENGKMPWVNQVSVGAAPLMTRPRETTFAVR